MNRVIPDEIFAAAQMTEEEGGSEIAIMLYQQEKINSGKVRVWTGLTVLEFQRELKQRGLYLNSDIEEFEADLQTIQTMT